MTPKVVAEYMLVHIARDSRNRALCFGVDFTDQIKAIIEKYDRGEDAAEDFAKYEDEVYNVWAERLKHDTD